MTIKTKFAPGDVVKHIVGDDARGVIVAFMTRGKNHCYEVQWGVKDKEWHNDFELISSGDPPKQIGFWPKSSL